MELNYDKCGTNYDKNILFVIVIENSYICSSFTSIQTGIMLKCVLYVLLLIYGTIIFFLLLSGFGNYNELI